MSMEWSSRDDVRGRVDELVAEHKLDDAIALLEGFADEALEIEDRIWGLVELARLQAQTSPQLAITTYESVLQLDISHKEATLELGRLYSQQGRWQDFAELLEMRTAFLEDPDQQAEACVGLAEIQQTNLGDEEAAIASLERALDLVPDHAKANDRLLDHYAARWDWARLRDLCERILAFEPNDERARRELDRLGETEAPAEAGAASASSPRRRPWWKFWTRRGGTAGR